MTMTTSNRFELWLKTVQSLRDNVNLSAIHKCVIIDDGSPPDDRTKMLALFAAYFPTIPVSILLNDCGGQFRHQHSLELWRAVINDEEQVFHCEDDFDFNGKSPDALNWASILLAQHEWIGQCVFVRRRRNAPLAASAFWVLTQENSPDFAPSRFTLQPSVIRVSSIKATGGFRKENCEVEFGYRWAGRGYVPVYHPTGICEHMSGVSAYEINASRR